LVTDGAPAEEDVVRFVEADMDEAMEAFRQGWIDLFEVPPQFTMKRESPGPSLHAQMVNQSCSYQ
jgi:hypothetical protein